MLPASITASQSVLPFFRNCIRSHVPATHLGSSKPPGIFNSSAAAAAADEADPFVPTEIFSGGDSTAVAAESEAPAPLSEEAFNFKGETGRFFGLRVKKKWFWVRWGLEFEEERVAEKRVRGENEAMVVDMVCIVCVL